MIGEVYCSEIATKKRKSGIHPESPSMYVYERCGCRASYAIRYNCPMADRSIVKTLCKRHYKSVVAWLDRIKVEHEILNNDSSNKV